MSIFATSVSGDYDKLAYDFHFNDLDGRPLYLSKYKNKVIIVVNVASQCGFTKQYEDMQNIWEKYQTRGIIMLGVPSNDFGNQEPGDNKEIKNFCESKFGITFPMTEKVSVKGETHIHFINGQERIMVNQQYPNGTFIKLLLIKREKLRIHSHLLLILLQKDLFCL